MPVSPAVTPAAPGPAATEISLDALAPLALAQDQEALHARLAATGAALRARYRAAIDAAPGERRTRVPARGGWSALQVLEHLVVAHDDYARVVAPIVYTTAASRGDTAVLPGTQWKPSLVGRLVTKSLLAQRPLPAPRSWRVAAMTPRADVARALDQRLADLATWMEATRDREWRRTRTHSPISPLLRINLGDVFVLLTVHAGRHLGQMERALGES